MGVMLAAARVYRPVLRSRWGRHANGFLLAGVAVVGGSIWLFRDRIGFIPMVLGHPLLSFGLRLLVVPMRPARLRAFVCRASAVAHASGAIGGAGTDVA